MSAPQGWYDAGTPGRQRWWDGVQWSAQERDTPVSSPPMGWYQVPGTQDVRWWDGAIWTPYRVRGGKPRPDALAIEPPVMGLVLGILFFLLAMIQLGGALLTQSPGSFIVPILWMAVAVIWIIGAMHTRTVRKLPVPQSAPFVDPVVQPLPGEVDGPDAGWYPMTAQVSRWWTGSRWSWYTGARLGVRPGHVGPRGYLTLMIVGWCVAAIAVVALIVAVVGGTMQQNAGTGFMIVLGIILAVMFAVLAAFILLLMRSRRNALLLPKTPPPVR